MDIIMEQLELAKKLIIENKLSEAFLILQQLVKEYPNDDGVRLEIGKIHYINGNYSEAKRNLELIKDRSNYQITLLLIKTYKFLKEPFPSLDILKKLVEEYPQEDDVRLELGKVYYLNGDYIKAKENLETLKNKKDYQVDFLLAKTYKSLGNSFSSLKILLKLYRLSGNKNHEVEDVILDVLASKFTSNSVVLCIKFLLKNNIKNKCLVDFFYLFVRKTERKTIDVELSNLSKIKYLNYKKEIIKLIKLFDKYTDKTEYKRIKNILLNEYEMLERKTILKSYPRKIEFNLTNKCNLSCIMCTKESHSCDFFAPDKLIDELIDIMPYLQSLTLRGGEVFLHSRLFEILEKSKKNELFVEIITNGLLLNDSIINKIMQLNEFLTLTFSIDSLDKNKYEFIRRGGKFDKLMENISLFNEKRKNNGFKGKININMVVMSINYKEIEDIIEFAGKNSLSVVQLIPVQDNEEYSLDNEKLEFINKKLYLFEQIAQKYNILIINKIPYSLLNKKEKGVVKKNRINKRKCKNEYEIDINKMNFFNLLKSYFIKLFDVTTYFCFYIKRFISVKLKRKFINPVKRKINKNLNLYKINKYISDLLKKIEFIKESRKRKKVQQLFCEKPYSSMLVDIYDNAEMCPSCLCNKKYLDPDDDLTNADNSILLSWNRPSFQYYRKCMSCYNELKICSKRCLYNNLLTK